MDDALLLTPAEIERRRVFAWLQARPAATLDEWRALGEEGLQRLFAIAATARTGVRANRLRGAALCVLGQLGDEAHINVLLEAFEDREAISVVRCGAIEGLGYLGRPRAIPLLQSQAYHGDFRVRLYAVGALARIGTPMARRVLRDVAERDPHPQVRRAAAVELVEPGAEGPDGVRIERAGMAELEPPDGETIESDTVGESLPSTLGWVGPPDPGRRAAGS